VIILDESKEEEEVHEEATTNTNAAPSTTVGRTLTSAASLANADEDLRAASNDSSDGLAPGPKMGKDNDDRYKAGAP
jgi:hypothetical protein